MGGRNEFVAYGGRITCVTRGRRVSYVYLWGSGVILLSLVVGECNMVRFV